MRGLNKSVIKTVSIFLIAVICNFSYLITPVNATDADLVNGLLGQYYDTAQPDDLSCERLIKIDENVEANWQVGSPDASIEPDTFSVVWTGFIQVPAAGNYNFYTYSDDGVQLSIGGNSLINRWGLVNLEFTKSNQALNLQPGVKYPFTLKYQEIPINATIFLFWQRNNGQMSIVPPSAFYVSRNHYTKYITPVHVNVLKASGNGLGGEYFNGAQTVTNANAVADYTVNGESVKYEWGSAAPGPGISEDDFSARWTGYLEAQYTGDITLQIVSDDGVRMWIDDNLVLDKWSAYSNVLHEVPIAMENGKFYKIKIEYNDLTGGATCVLYWKSRFEERDVIPQKYLYSSEQEPNPPGPDPDPGPGTDPGPPPEPQPNADFINYLMDHNLYVYGNNAIIDGSSRINGSDATVVIRNSFSPGFGDVSYITTKNIYIQGNVNLNGSAGLGSYNGTSNIYVGGNVSVSGGPMTAAHLGRIFGHLYYTGSLTVPPWIILAAQTQKVSSIDIPQFDIPALRSDAWYSARGYNSSATARDNMKYFGSGFIFPTWGSYSNVTIASRGDIILPDNVQVSGILFAPNGMVNIIGSSSFSGIIVAKGLNVMGDSSVTFQSISDADELPF